MEGACHCSLTTSLHKNIQSNSSGLKIIRAGMGSEFLAPGFIGLSDFRFGLDSRFPNWA